MQIGTVAALWRYPVKSLAAQAMMRAQVEADGIVGDRAAALLVRSAEHARAGKPLRGKEHRLLHTTASEPAARAAVADLDVELELVAGERFFDAQPISLLWDTWLADVEQLVGAGLDPLRYRPNLFAHASAGFSDREPALVGARLTIGETVLRVVAAIGRCVTTTYDIATGDSNPAVLREVAQRRDNKVGVYCTVERTGFVAVGDVIDRS